jgi:hypothetical protein
MIGEKLEQRETKEGKNNVIITGIGGKGDRAESERKRSI